jgi:hypothetical protein
VAYKFNQIIKWLKEELKKDRDGKPKDNKDLSLESDSFATKMLLRIIDNVIIDINNIHIRFEDNKSFAHQFSLGLLIDRISVETTDYDHNRQFYHRSFNKKKKNERLIKSVTVSPIKVYWNQFESHFIKDAVDSGYSKGEIIWLMRSPFPNFKDQTIPVMSKKKTTSGTETQISSPELDVENIKKDK